MAPAHEVWPTCPLPKPLRPAKRPDMFALIGFIGALMIVAAFTLIMVGRGPGAPGTGTLQGSTSGRPPPGFDPPRPMPTNGELVRSRVLASGELKVDHWIRSSYPIYALTLRVPPALHRAEPGTLIARHITVQSDGSQFSPMRSTTARSTAGISAGTGRKFSSSTQ